ncbi:DUF1512 domain-containing protein [Desulfurococcaceae archaeon MEX13E-LK6-19]|nr:DUF1512 domain-containing protein [Desulfurococcaceae archaeon MEX13E-LK6-19]
MSGDWSDYIGQIIFLIFFLMLFTGLNQRIQMKLWAFDIRNKLSYIGSRVEESKSRLEEVFRRLGVKEPAPLLARYLDFFTIEPVSIEPTDIIKRLDHLLSVRENVFKDSLKNIFPKLSRYERSLIESSIEIASVLNFIYKVVRHYLLIGEKYNNWILLMQLQFQMPEILRIVDTYYKSFSAFLQGTPIGDAAGPLLAVKLAEEGRVLSKRIVEDVVVIEAWIRDRRVFIIKAEGPGSNVGKPGKAIAKIIEELNGNVDLVVTVDAALKLEGETVGEIAEGVGAAIGDPGPEKIAIERATSKYNIPLRALVIKMGLEDALYPMKKEIYEAVERAKEYILKIIEESTSPGSTVLVAGIGNTIGVAQ